MSMRVRSKLVRPLSYRTTSFLPSIRQPFITKLPVGMVSRTFSTSHTSMPKKAMDDTNYQQRHAELFSDLDKKERKLKCAVDTLSFEQKKEIIIYKSISLIDWHISYPNNLSEASLFEKFLQTLNKAKTTDDLNSAYLLISDLLKPDEPVKQFYDLLILNKRTEDSVHKFNEDMKYYNFSTSAWVEYQVKINHLREALCQVIDEIKTNDMWLSIRPNAKTLEYIQAELTKENITEVELAKIVYENFVKKPGLFNLERQNKPLFKMWSNLKYAVQKHDKNDENQSNQYISSAGKLLFSMLEPNFSESIYPEFPEKDIQLLSDVERFEIQYNLANDDERISSARYYGDIYGYGGVSDAAIRERMIVELKKITLLGDQKTYHSFIEERREIYKNDCLNPAYWYEPIPEKIWSDIIKNIQTIRVEKGVSRLPEEDIKFINDLLESKWGKYALREGYCNIIDLPSFPESIKVDLLIILNREIKGFEKIDFILKKLYFISALEKIDRERFIQVLFSEHGVTVLEQKLFSVFEVCYLSSLSNEKFNQLLTLLNGEDPTTSNALTSEIQQLVLGKEESAQAHCIFRPH
jgi:hypothetical protein